MQERILDEWNIIITEKEKIGTKKMQLRIYEKYVIELYFYTYVWENLSFVKADENGKYSTI